MVALSANPVPLSGVIRGANALESAAVRSKVPGPLNNERSCIPEKLQVPLNGNVIVRCGIIAVVGVALRDPDIK